MFQTSDLASHSTECMNQPFVGVQIPSVSSFTAVVVSELALQPSFMRIISELPSFNGFRQESALHRAEMEFLKEASRI